MHTVQLIILHNELLFQTLQAMQIAKLIGKPSSSYFCELWQVVQIFDTQTKLLQKWKISQILKCSRSTSTAACFIKS
jgi:hypothetical protein